MIPSPCQFLCTSQAPGCVVCAAHPDSPTNPPGRIGLPEGCQLPWLVEVCVGCRSAAYGCTQQVAGVCSGGLTGFLPSLGQVCRPKLVSWLPPWCCRLRFWRDCRCHNACFVCVALFHANKGFGCSFVAFVSVQAVPDDGRQVVSFSSSTRWL